MIPAQAIASSKKSKSSQDAEPAKDPLDEFTDYEFNPEKEYPQEVARVCSLFELE